MTGLVRPGLLTLFLLTALAACTQITPDQEEILLHRANWHGVKAS